jgi:hypothetical protein
MNEDEAMIQEALKNEVLAIKDAILKLESEQTSRQINIQN